MVCVVGWLGGGLDWICPFPLLPRYLGPPNLELSHTPLPTSTKHADTQPQVSIVSRPLHGSGRGGRSSICVVSGLAALVDVSAVHPLGAAGEKGGPKNGNGTAGVSLLRPTSTQCGLLAKLCLVWPGLGRPLEGRNGTRRRMADTNDCTAIPPAVGCCRAQDPLETFPAPRVDWIMPHSAAVLPSFATQQWNSSPKPKTPIPLFARPIQSTQPGGEAFF
ncbi:hypothetical protein F5144DRAFT_270469 [Chaetomium tenue]|uniref:Uncharacterized protein n=1 Tax=Chaetomium tenue TaxID=1854479 RepID=A0ACB7P418_9PEZI|nr:hypothetical protein F5144DRAFT_270469 [Chaetomium globosum]